jgi:Relaxase/Mobilisation nuclease domain
MFETWRDRTKLKREAGVDLRGRDNKTPVLHYTLSWALDEKPTAEHMKETALSSLKALKLDQHQALIVAHGDKEHVHLHVVANTVHPETGRTAPLKYAKLALSRWAEAYEREHGIHCQ